HLVFEKLNFSFRFFHDLTRAGGSRGADAARATSRPAGGDSLSPPTVPRQYPIDIPRVEPWLTRLALNTFGMPSLCRVYTSALKPVRVRVPRPPPYARCDSHLRRDRPTLRN